MRLALALALLPLPALAEVRVDDSLDLVSQVDELTVTDLHRLPANPDALDQVEFCTAVITPSSGPGQAVARKGWAVTGEVEANGLTFISFAGRLDLGTSGSCLLSEGNIAIFRKTSLMGLIYAEAGARRGIGAIAAQEGALRVWDGDYPARPLADLRLHGSDLVVVSAVASRDPYCEGAVSLPNLYGLPIHLARRFLLDEGWTPVPAKPEDLPFTRDLSAILPEVQGCSGTGFGFCDFAYDQGGAVLSVTTMGEAEPPDSPAVVGYGVTCP